MHLPDGSGEAIIDAVARRRDRTLRFLALSVSDAAEDVIAVIRAGARGYVTKTISGEELAAGDRAGRLRATPSSRRGWRASCSTRSRSEQAAPASGARRSSPRASARCCS